MLRGNDRQNLFIDEEDKNKIIQTVAEKKGNNAFYIYAYCVMDNHVHFVLKEGKEEISLIMKRIATTYANYFNKKYRRIGHVFQDRYKSENIEDESYLFSVIRYVHQNPLKAGVCSVEEYKWSSYKDYIRIKPELADVDDILLMISNNKDTAIREFVSFSHKSATDLFIDVKEEKEINRTNARKYINDYLNTRNMGSEELKKADKKQERDELIRLLLDKSNLSRREIAAVLGLNRELVRKISMSKEPSP